MSCSKLEGVLKCAFCGEIVDTPKTLTCFHSLCSKCITQLPKTIEEGKSGICCPNCTTFSGEEHVTSRFLVNELLHIHSQLEDHDNICQQCSEEDSKWNCADCRMALCHKCKVNHLKIPICKNHRIVKKNTADEMVVDGLVFCTFHPDKPVEFSCKDCDVPFCIKCKVSQHENHKTETIEEALQRMMPQVDTNKVKLQQMFRTYNRKGDEITAKIAEVKEAFVKCRDEARNHINEVINKAKTQHDQLLKQLNLKEGEVLAKLEITRSEVESNKKKYKQICDWVNTSTETAKGVTLMTELQAGLYSKMSEMTKNQTSKPLCVDLPQLTVNMVHEMNMMGNVRYTSSELSANNTEGVSGRVDSFKTLFAKHLKPATTTKLKVGSARMAMVNSDIWIPCRDSNIIQVVNQDDQVVKDIDYANRPRSVTQAINGDIIVASDSGLHIIDEDGNAEEIISGKFCDLSVDGEYMVALQHNNMVVHVFKCAKASPAKWVKETDFSVEALSVNNNSTILYCNYMIYISVPDYRDNIIYQYTANGHYIKDHSLQGLRDPYICERDQNDNILIADYNNRCLQILHQDGDSEKINVPALSSPLDVICHGDTVWILCWSNGLQLKKYNVL